MVPGDQRAHVLQFVENEAGRDSGSEPNDSGHPVEGRELHPFPVSHRLRLRVHPLVGLHDVHIRLYDRHGHHEVVGRLERTCRRHGSRAWYHQFAHQHALEAGSDRRGQAFMERRRSIEQGAIHTACHGRLHGASHVASQTHHSLSLRCLYTK